MQTGINGSALFFSGAAKSSRATRSRGKFGNDFELDLQYRYDDQLGDAFHRLDGEGHLAAIPHRDKNLPLIVGIDQADEIAEHDAVFMPQSGARQNHGCISGIGNVNGDSRRHQRGFAGFERDGSVNASTQIEPGGTRGGVLWKLIEKTVIEYTNIKLVSLRHV